jgi:hypothetical protein
MKFSALLTLMLFMAVNQIFSQSKLSVHVGNPAPIYNNSGDTWVSAVWVGDTLYSPSNDSKGFYFSGLNQGGGKNISFNKIIYKDNYLYTYGFMVNKMDDYGLQGQKEADGRNWKSSGCYGIEGIIYWVVARHTYGEDSDDAKKRQKAENASIIKSYDYGKTWVRSAGDNYNKPMFPGKRFATPYFIQYGNQGAASVDNADKYVYAVSNNGFWDNGDNVILGRVLRSKIADLNGNDWQFYTGGDGMKNESWSGDMNQAKLIIDNPGKLGMSGIVYDTPLKKYLYIGWYYPAGSGKIAETAPLKSVWDFYESDKPWGPWTRFDSCVFEPHGYYTPQICPQLISSDGKKLTVITAGYWNNDLAYRLTFVPAELIDK